MPLARREVGLATGASGRAMGRLTQTTVVAYPLRNIWLSDKTD